MDVLDVTTLTGTGAMHYGGAYERIYPQEAAIPEHDRMGLKRGLKYIWVIPSLLSPSTIFYFAWLTES